jgi:hypothetical protein
VKHALHLIPAKTELIEVQGAGHDLGFKGKVQKKELPAKIVAKFEQMFA